MTGRRAAIVDHHAPSLRRLAHDPRAAARRGQGAAAADRDDKKSKRTWSGPRYNNSTGGASTPRGGESPSHTSKARTRHEPAAGRPARARPRQCSASPQAPPRATPGVAAVARINKGTSSIGEATATNAPRKTSMASSPQRGASSRAEPTITKIVEESASRVPRARLIASATRPVASANAPFASRGPVSTFSVWEK